MGQGPVAADDGVKVIIMTENRVISCVLVMIVVTTIPVGILAVEGPMPAWAVVVNHLMSAATWAYIGCVFIGKKFYG